MGLTHTPGPWFVVAQNNAGSLGTSVWAMGGDVRVADCNSAAISLEGRRADARLIAAAPDLLVALEKINEWACFATEEDVSAKLMALQQIGIHARAAIAKATGGA
jgi:hypothetical protein